MRLKRILKLTAVNFIISVLGYTTIHYQQQVMGWILFAVLVAYAIYVDNMVKDK